MPTVLKSWSLNLLEPSRPVQGLIKCILSHALPIRVRVLPKESICAFNRKECCLLRHELPDGFYNGNAIHAIRKEEYLNLYLYVFEAVFVGPCHHGMARPQVADWRNGLRYGG